MQNEGILRSRGQAVDGRRRAEPPISAILDMSAIFVVTFRAYRGKEASKKAGIRFNISKEVCLKVFYKIWLERVEKGRSEGTRTKCAPCDIEPVPHRFITFRSIEMN